MIPVSPHGFSSVRFAVFQPTNKFAVPLSISHIDVGGFFSRIIKIGFQCIVFALKTPQQPSLFPQAISLAKQSALL